MIGILKVVIEGEAGDCGVASFLVAGILWNRRCGGLRLRDIGGTLDDLEHFDFGMSGEGLKRR
jgi:hypothetical protein